MNIIKKLFVSGKESKISKDVLDDNITSGLLPTSTADDAGKVVYVNSQGGYETRDPGYGEVPEEEVLSDFPQAIVRDREFTVISSFSGLDLSKYEGLKVKVTVKDLLDTGISGIPQNLTVSDFISSSGLEFRTSTSWGDYEDLTTSGVIYKIDFLEGKVSAKLYNTAGAAFAQNATVAEVSIVIPSSSRPLLSKFTKKIVKFSTDGRVGASDTSVHEIANFIQQGYDVQGLLSDGSTDYHVMNLCRYNFSEDMTSGNLAFIIISSGIRIVGTFHKVGEDSYDEAWETK